MSLRVVIEHRDEKNVEPDRPCVKIKPRLAFSGPNHKPLSLYCLGVIKHTTLHCFIVTSINDQEAIGTTLLLTKFFQ